jgi:hypothetical protein
VRSALKTLFDQIASHVTSNPLGCSL